MGQGLRAVVDEVHSSVMSREVRQVEGSGQNASVLPSMSPCWIVLAALVAGCGAERKANESVVNDSPSTVEQTPVVIPTTEPAADTLPVRSSVLGCQTTRMPIANPDGGLLDTLDRLAGSYPIGGAWGTPAQLDFTPKEAPFEGELIVSRRDGDLVQLGGCSSGIEVPVAVTVRTTDGGLAENVGGIVVLTDQPDMTTDGSPAPFRAELSAVVDLGALSGSFAFADDPGWTIDDAELRAELTPFGTRGMLGAKIEPIAPVGLRAVSPLALEPLLTWDGGDDCVGGPGSQPEPALFPAPTEARAALDAALEMASAQTYRAKYADGTETRVALEFAPLTVLCATSFWASYWHFPTRVHLKTDDGRLDVSIGVTVDPGFARLHYNELTEVPGAYPPSRVDEQIGHIDASVLGYATVGIETWFDLTPEPAGWLKVLGYDDGACAHCDESGGCIECAFDQRIEILSLFIGTQADTL